MHGRCWEAGRNLTVYVSVCMRSDHTEGDDCGVRSWRELPRPPPPRPAPCPPTVTWTRPRTCWTTCSSTGRSASGPSRSDTALPRIVILLI